MGLKIDEWECAATAGQKSEPTLQRGCCAPVDPRGSARLEVRPPLCRLALSACRCGLAVAWVCLGAGLPLPAAIPKQPQPVTDPS